MENINYALTSANQSQMPVTLRALFGSQPISGDAFSQLFAQLMAGYNGEMPEGMDALFTNGEGEGDQDLSMKDNVLAQGLMADMFFQNPDLFQQLLEQDGAEGLVSYGVTESGMPDVLAGVSASGGDNTSSWQAWGAVYASGQQGVNAVTEGLDQAAAKAAQQGTPFIPSAETTPMRQIADIEAEGQKRQNPEEQQLSYGKENAMTGAQPQQAVQAKENPFTAQGQFMDAVRQARQTLGSLRFSASNEEDIDVEALQSAADNNRVTPNFGAPAELPKQEAPQPVAQQTQSAIQTNLAQGKKDFTIRLKPDGLGEITVHLSEKAGKTTLNIITSSTEVAKMLTDDIASLRNALRPLQVEVHTIAAQPQQQEVEAAHNQNYGQSMQQQQQENQQPNGQNHHRHALSFFDEAEEEEVWQDETDPTAELDTYI